MRGFVEIEEVGHTEEIDARRTLRSGWCASRLSTVKPPPTRPSGPCAWDRPHPLAAAAAQPLRRSRSRRGRPTGPPSPARRRGRDGRTAMVGKEHRPAPIEEEREPAVPGHRCLRGRPSWIHRMSGGGALPSPIPRAVEPPVHGAAVVALPLDQLRLWAARALRSQPADGGDDRARRGPRHYTTTWLGVRAPDRMAPSRSLRHDNPPCTPLQADAALPCRRRRVQRAEPNSLRVNAMRSPSGDHANER